MRIVLSERRGDLGRLDVAGQAVATEEEPVARRRGAVDNIEFGLIGGAERARDDIAARPGFGFGGFENAAVEEVLHLRMIARELFERARAPAVDAAVAAPDGREVRLVEQHRRQRRPDDRTAASFREVAELRVDGADAGFEIVEQFLRRTGRGQTVQRGDDGGARDIPAAVAAHAVGDGEEPDLGSCEMPILVERSHLAHVGGRADAQRK